MFFNKVMIFKSYDIQENFKHCNRYRTIQECIICQPPIVLDRLLELVLYPTTQYLCIDISIYSGDNFFLLFLKIHGYKP